MPMNKKACHNTHVPLHCYCSLHINPTLLQMSIRKQQTVIFISCHIVIYVLAKNKSTKSILPDMHILVGFTNVYATYEVTCYYNHHTYFANYNAPYCHIPINKWGCQITHLYCTALLQQLM